MTRLDVRKWSMVVVGLLLFGLVGWLYLEEASGVAARGYTIRKLENDKERLRREITALRSEVAAAGSLERIRRAGEELGYVLPDATDSARLVIEYVPLGNKAGAGPETDLREESSASAEDGQAQGSGLLAGIREWLGLANLEGDY